MTRSPLEDLRAALGRAALAAAGAQPPPQTSLERPPQADFGDYSTNVALLLAKPASRAPRDLAQEIGAALSAEAPDVLDRFDVAGPGFLNLHVSDAWLRSALHHVLDAGPEYGSQTLDPAARERIDIEFVSANPTGPLTAASGRHAAYGDAVARILAFHGHDVQREYYINDWGTQVQRLGESIKARALGEPVPDDGYQGDYVATLVDAQTARDAPAPELARAGVQALLTRIETTLTDFGITFDTWFAESSLYEPADRVSPIMARLQQDGHAYESEDALWLRTSDHGDDKDRVLRRATGENTYFASDIANHQQKLDRGFDRLIDVWGADHHGYVTRMRAALETLGVAPERFEVVILQFVHLVESGDRAKMSKRRGDFVTLDDLIAEIGVDAARWFLVSAAPDTTIDLDLDLAREHSASNPVYYVQYAHARIASMLGRAGARRVASAGEALAAQPALDPDALHLSERALIKKLLAFPTEVAEASNRCAPHRICAYALELAQEFTAFYRDCRVIGAESEALESQRIALSLAAQRTIAAALGLLGVSAPDAM